MRYRPRQKLVERNPIRSDQQRALGLERIDEVGHAAAWPPPG
jgi:hypothetical protein